MVLEHEEITKEIIGSALEVYRILDYGFLEKVYQGAMLVELIKRGHEAKIEEPISVHYKGFVVGKYFADLLVDEKVIVELKAAKEYNSLDEAQLLNQLKGTGMKAGLLMNFGRTEVEFK